MDGINAKIAIQHDITGDETLVATGSVAFPIGHQFGLQLDGGFANLDTAAFGRIPVYGAGAHLFWRDPDWGLAGLYGNLLHVNDFGGLNYYRGAVEFERYLGRFSFETMVGLTGGDFIDVEPFTQATLAYYPMDDLRFEIGHSFTVNENAFDFGGEWAFGAIRSTAAAMYVNGSVFEGGGATASAGLRFYFGQNDKPLINRHREDDPRVYLYMWGYIVKPFGGLFGYRGWFETTCLRNISPFACSWRH
ncbi:MAG: hypothetical protein AB3N20_13535 [Rhizobiaceae bacterium]